jgi:serine/threonine-protein kinase RsbW
MFPGRYQSLAKISEFVLRVARSAGLNEREAYAVQLAVDEACANIIDHAYGGEGEGEIACTCEVIEDGLRVVLVDQGEPFEPDHVPTQDYHVPLEELKPRGAGLYLMRQMMDEVDFEFDDKAGNVLTMIKRRGDTDQAPASSTDSGAR